MRLISDLRQVSRMGLLVAISAATVGIVYGYDQSNIAGALLFMEDDLQLSDFTKGWVVSAVVAGELVGVLFGGELSNRVGRKPSMLLVAGTFALFSLATAVAWDVPSMLAARFLLGLTVGVSLVVVPVFVAESSAPNVRGALLVLYQFATISGIIIAYLLAWYLAQWENWRAMLGLAAVPAVIVLVLLLRIPDTARWYLMKGRREDARKVLAMVDPAADPDVEIAEIEQALHSDAGGDESLAGRLAEMFRPPYLRASIFVMGLGFFVQATGINAIVYFSPTIFEKMGFDENAYSAILGLPALVQVAGLVAVMASMSRVDGAGRRPVLMSGIAMMLAADALMVVVYLFGGDFGGAWTVIGFLAMVLLVVGFSSGFGSLVWVYAGESFPARLRSLGASLMLTANLTANLIVGVIFLKVFNSLGGAFTFGALGVIAFAALVFAYKMAPETKGRGLEEIRFYWENGGTWPDEAVTVTKG